jgi:hypothetical protein
VNLHTCVIGIGTSLAGTTGVHSERERQENGEGAVELFVRDQVGEMGNAIDEIRMVLRRISFQLLLSLLFLGLMMMPLFSGGKARLDFLSGWVEGELSGAWLFSMSLPQWLVFVFSLMTVYFFSLRTTILARLLKYKERFERKFGVSGERNWFESNWIAEWRVYSLGECGNIRAMVRPFGEKASIGLIAHRALFLFYLLAPVGMVLVAAWILWPASLPAGMVDGVAALWMVSEIRVLLR